MICERIVRLLVTVQNNKDERYLLTSLLTYLITYLRTYLLHGAESFLRC